MFYGDRFQVRLSAETNFHRKAFLVAGRRTVHLVVGSSNFSKNGLTSAGELNVLVSFPAGTRKAKATAAAFNRAWSDAVELTQSRIVRYDKLRVPPDPHAVSKLDLRSIIGPSAKHTVASAPPTKAPGRTSSSRMPKHWVDGIDGFAAKQTALVIADETSWDRKGWWWRTCRPDGYVRGDEVLLLDRSSTTRWASITRVADVVPRTATPTPDGRSFVAYKPVARLPRRKLTTGFLRDLRKAGVRADGARAVVSAGAWDRVRELFA
jgi:phosphatidylserine/phosphatidylglycerophosphate/cardiolipin synthase-like enzyme